MTRPVLSAAVFAWAFAGAASALPATPADGGLRVPDARSTDRSIAPPPEADAAPPTAAAPAEALSPGMPVKDRAGRTVGAIKRIGQTAHGAPAVEVEVDGKPVTMAMSALTLAPTRDRAISEISREQARAAASRSAP